MNARIETDWQKHKTWLKVGDVEYEVVANVFLTIRSGSQKLEHFGTECSEPWSTVDAELDGWEALPEPPAEHLEELEQKLLKEIESEVWI